MKLVKIKFLFSLILVALMPAVAVATCADRAWTYNWQDPNNKFNAMGCKCQQNNNNAKITKYEDGKKTFWQSRDANNNNSRKECPFPTYSVCGGTAGSTNAWRACSGVWLRPNTTQKVPTNMSNVITSKHVDGWHWGCKAGYKINATSDGCVVDANSCVARNGYIASNGTCVVCTDGKIAVGQSCKNALASGQGYISPTNDSVMDCGDLKLETGQLYRTIIDNICVRCWDGSSAVKGFVKSTTEYLADGGNCGVISTIPQDYIIRCAIRTDFESCVEEAINSGQ